ncbi:MAG: peptidase S51 [Acidobacteria bacterium]|nr:peptidase S51 [Acidobacteriota bacterium]
MHSLLLAFTLLAETQFGPQKGSLMIVGGGAIGPEIWERFLKQAGGPDAPIVYIPTASEREPNENSGSILKKAGFEDVTVLHTRDRKLADTDDFVAPLKRARAVFFEGGRQWRIVDSYEGTKTEHELMQVLRRGGIIGGTSAGATIQGSYLVRGAVSGNEIMMSPGHERGFGYLRNSAIDQHLLKRGRENDLWQVIAKYPKLLGIGLDEGTAILVEGDQFEVLGVSKVAIYDNAQRPHFFLEQGDRFDMLTRRKR